MKTKETKDASPNFKLRMITIHQPEIIFGLEAGASGAIAIDDQKLKGKCVELEEEPSGKVNVFFKDKDGKLRKSSISAGNIKAYHYETVYPVEKETK